MIVKMKKAHLVVFQEDKDALLKSLQHYAVIMITSQEDSSNIRDTQNEEVMLQRASKTITMMKKYRETKPKIGEVTIVNYDEFVKEDQEAIKIIEEMEHLEEQINNAKAVIGTTKEELKLDLPWLSMPYMLNELSATKYTNVHVGYIDARKIDTFTSKMEEYGCIYNLYEKSRLGQAISYFVFKDDEEDLDQYMKEVGYVDANLPIVNKTMAGIVEEKNEKIADNERLITESLKQMVELSKRIETIQIYSDQLLTKKILKSADYANTNITTFIEGWVRSDQLEKLEKAVKEATDVYDIEISDPAEGEIPPTFTKNNRVVSQFEGITDMFSKPKYDEIDPNPVMSFWYWVLFGMMVGDFGYGILLLVFAVLFIKIAKPKGGTKKLAKIIAYSSVTTALWGIVFNSFFGASLFGEASIFGANSIFGTNSFMTKITFAPLDSAMTMLVISVIIGALHIMTGIVVKAIANIKNGEILDMISGQLSWLLIFIGIGCYAGSMFLKDIPYLNYIGIGCAGLGAVLIILFKGHHKKGLIGKGLSGVLGLYDITGYMSDLLSYTRIMALVMSSAAVAMVMNTLAGMLQGSVFGFIMSLFVYAIGHIFNLVLGLLSAYVHDSRLQYIEFYGKFYEGGGYDFRPLSIETKYVYEIKEN